VTPLSIIIVGVLIILDQITKFLVSANLKAHEAFPVFKDVFHITLIHNKGAAFGFFKGMLPLFILLSIVTIFLIILYANRFHQGYHYLRTGLLLILAGTIGNLIDRVRLGYVIDFIDLRIWPVFNIADMTITIGGAFLVYHILAMPKKESRE
jgi:signal peptidase II